MAVLCRRQPRSDECCYAIHLGPIQPNSHSLEACAEGTDHLSGADLILMTDRGRPLQEFFLWRCWPPQGHPRVDAVRIESFPFR